MGFINLGVWFTRKRSFFLLSDKKQCEDHEGGQNNNKVFSDTHQCMWVFLFLFFLGRWKIHLTRVLVRNIKNWIIPTGKHVNMLLQKISNHVNSSMHFPFLPLRFISINTYSKYSSNDMPPHHVEKIHLYL